MDGGGEALLPLAQIEQASEFEGFEQEDFAVFGVPEFRERMTLLKQRITPKLKQIAAALTARMGAALDETVFPHVAQHLRRSVNPPVETWVAFARSARAYKPYVHIRAGISEERLRVMVYVEDYAEDKLLFADNLTRNAGSIALWCAHHPNTLAYDIPGADGEPSRGHLLSVAVLSAFADRLRRVKGQHARFGIALAKSHPVVSSGPELLEAVVEAAKQLRPFYDCGKPGFVYQYEPEVVAGI